MRWLADFLIFQAKVCTRKPAFAVHRSDVAVCKPYVSVSLSDMTVYRRAVYVRPSHGGRTYTAARTHVRRAAVDGWKGGKYGKAACENGRLLTKMKLQSGGRLKNVCREAEW